MEEHTWSTVLGLSGLLMLAVLMVPAARRFNFPHTVLLAVVGVAIGLLKVVADDGQIYVISDFLSALHNLEITADAVLFVFLPVLVFEAALALDVRRLLEDLGSILFLAIFGLLVSTAVVGYSIHAISGVSLLVCLMLGAIVSATDPVAVVAIFKDVGAPKRLAILVEGESLFNDATAIVVFIILSGMVLETANPSLGGGVIEFMRVFVGGIGVGLALAFTFVAIIRNLRKMPLVERSLTISLAYLSFIIGEHYLHVSGVMAVVTAALVMASRGRTVIAPHDWHSLHEMWEQLGFWANSIIFVLVGLAVPGIMAGFGETQFIWLAVLIAAAFGARAGIIFGLMPWLSRINLAHGVSNAYKAVMFWGGLRGAVSLALALLVIENNAFPEAVREFVGVMVTGFVLFTLFVNAPTISLLISMLRLDQLSTTEVAVRDRALALSLGEIGTNIEAVARQQDSAEAVTEQLTSEYRHRSQMAQRKVDQLRDLNANDWVLIGLATLAAQERQSYAEQFEEGFLRSEIFRAVTKHIDDIADALKSSGATGYMEASEEMYGFGWQFRLAMQLHRVCGFTGPLSRRVAERFEVLTATKLALREISHAGIEKVLPLVGAAAGERLRALIDERLLATGQALDCLMLQYPEYAEMLQTRYLERGALQLEANSYSQMLADAVISPEVYKHLEEALEVKQRELDITPRLDLGLEPVNLVCKVPLFKDLDMRRLEAIAGLLKPRLVLPGETVVAKGDDGDAMYFVSSGSLCVELEPESVFLGSGDFFGELALVMHQPRNADVKALGFCDLLMLSTADFQKLMESNPEAMEVIEKVAHDRTTTRTGGERAMGDIIEADITVQNPAADVGRAD
ncbi:MAG: cation:proton antiporter [Pseudomonadota bacterium]